MEDIFSVRILKVDSFMSDPIQGLDLIYSDFKKSNIKHVPIIRLFGSTPMGQSVCCYLHGCFPYLLIPYTGPGGGAESQEVKKYLYQTALSLDHALNTAGGRKSNQEHVFKISLMCGRPYYGFHTKDEAFMKVYFYYPSDIKRSCDLLQAGAIMNCSFEPHEAHLSFILQFFLDYNLYGMNLLHSKCTWFRQPIDKANSEHHLSQYAKHGFESSQVNPKDSSSNATILHDVSTLTQIQHFNWNKLRKSAQDSELLLSDVSYNHKLSEDNGLHHNICSQKCQSLIFKSVLSSPGIALSNNATCPFHSTWTTKTIPPKGFLSSAKTKRASTCDLEVDILATDILNRIEISEITGKNPGIQSIWEDERARRRLREESSQIHCPLSQNRRPNVVVSNKETLFLKDLNCAVNLYHMDKQASRKETHTLLAKKRKDMKPKKQSGDFFKDKDSESTNSCSPIVHDHIVSQVLSTSQSWNNSGNSNTVLNLLQDMDTAYSDRQRCLYSQYTNDDLESDEEIWDSCETSEQKNNLLDSNKKLNMDESFEMTQPWESGIEHLLNRSDYPDSGQPLEDDIDIPQLDGTSDEILGKGFSNNKGLDTSKRHTVQTSKSSEILNVTTFGNTNLTDAKSVCSKVDAIAKDVSKNTSDLGLSKETQANIAKAICKKIKQQHSTTVEAAVPVTKIDHNSNMFSTLQTLLDDVNLLKQKVLKKSVVSTRCSTLPSSDKVNMILPEQKQTPDKTVIDLENNCTLIHETKLLQNDSLPDDNVQPPNYNSSLCKNSTLCFPNMGGASVTISKPGVVVASWDSDKKSNVSERSKSTITNRHSKLSKSSLRPRRSRHISSYVSDPLFETVFENDWDEMVDTFNVQRRTKGLKTASQSKISKKNKPKLKNVKQTKQEKVFIKWIITNRFKGVHKMKIGLWRIPTQNQVVLSQELLELYDQYSPRGNKIRTGPCYGAFSETRISIPPKLPVPQVVKPKIPKGRRTKENVVTKFHPLFNRREISDFSSNPTLEEKTHSLTNHNSVSPRQNLFSHALALSCDNFSEEPAKAEGQYNNSTLSGKDFEQANDVSNSTSTTNIFTALTNDIKTSIPSKKLPEKRIMTTKFTKQKKDKVDLVKKRAKAASKKFSMMFHGGRSCKAHFDMNKISLRKSHRKAARKLKYKEKIRRSHVLPVINRTVTPINQSTEELTNKEVRTKSKEICSAPKGECAVSNIFVKITPFVASETVAMLQTMPSVGVPEDASPCISVESDCKTTQHLASKATRSQSTLIGPSTLVKTLQRVVQPTSPQVPTVQKHYLPTRRVTRHSVTARMKALKVPEWMCDSNVGDNPNEIDNVLAILGRQSPIPPDSKRPVTPPRPWSPMLTPKQLNTNESTTLNNINSGFDLDDVSMLNDIEGMEEIIKGVKISTSQDTSEEDDNLLSHLDALLQGESFATVTADDTSALLADAMQEDAADKDVNQPSTSLIDILLNDKSLKSQDNDFYVSEPSQQSLPELQQSFILRSASPTNNKIEEYPSISKVSPDLKSHVGKSPKYVAVNGDPTTCVGENFSKTDVHTPSNKSLLCNTRALPNKQTLQEQLHKQMQAVFLQQQMLDNNNFRSADFLCKNPIRQKPKIMDANKQSSTPAKVDSSKSQPMQKDILDEAFQHVISDSSIPLNVSEGLSTFDIMLGSSSHYNDKDQSSNTFLYPCQPLETSAVKSEKNASSLNISHPGPILTMPVNLPVSNPVQVLHTHVHHHHHIHSIKNDCNVSSDVSYTKSETQFTDKLLPTLPKREISSSKGWPDKNKENCFTQKLGNFQAVSAKTAQRFMNTNKEFSILSKPTCQNGDERYWLQIQMQHGIPWDGKRKVIKKEKVSEEPISNSPPMVLDTTTAKTPYGLMKQSQSSQELNVNKDKFTFSTSRKLGSWRRTAPSNTPTICLTQGQNQKASSGFELSQDIFEASNQETVKNPTLPNNCIQNPGSTINKKCLISNKSSKQAKSKQSRSCISKTNKMDGYCSRFTTVPFVTSQLSKPENNQRDKVTLPKNSSHVTDRQELILNYETGQLEVVDVVSSNPAIPIVVNSNQQTSESCISECEKSSKHACEKSSENTNLSCHTKETPAIDSSNSYAATTFKEEHISMSRISPRSDSSSIVLNDEKEYVVTSTDDDNLSLKLKLTLKKTPSNKPSSLTSTAIHKEEVTSYPISFKRKGKPSCYEEMVKRSKAESTKKTSIRKAPKKKQAKFYILETSISDEFTLIKERIYFPPLTSSPPENSCSSTKSAVTVFNSTHHFCLVQDFCHLRCKNVIAPVNMHAVVLEEQNVTVALGALQIFHGDVLKMCSSSETVPSDIIVAPLENEKGQPQLTSAPLSRDSPRKCTLLQSKKEAPVESSETCGDPKSVRCDKGNLATKPSCDVFTAHPAPPSKESVSKFLDASHLFGEGSNSDEPFFSDCGDLQPTSSRMFATLPAYVKIPKTKRCLKKLPEFDSTVSPGFNHWRMVLAANLLTSNIIDSSWVSKQVKDLLTDYKLENIDPCDIIATMTKLDTLPILRKAFVPFDKISVAKLSIQPPTFNQVEVWLHKQTSKLITTTNSPEQVHIKVMQNVPPSEISERPQINTKGAFKPRKVSFELFSAIDSLSQDDTRRHLSGEEIDDNFSSSEVITPNRFIDADSLSTNESLSMELSPHSETMVSFDFTQTSLIDKSGNGKSSSSSAIATLMGCTEKDSEEVSLTPLLSGQFALSQSSPTDNVHARLHSTPMAKSKPSDRNLVYTPIVCASQVAESSTHSLSRKILRGHVHEVQQKPHSLNTPTTAAVDSPYHSEITGPNFSNSYGFRAPQHDLGEAKSLHERQSVSVISMELHVKTRLDLRPDPELDSIQAIFFAVQKDSSNDIEIGAILNSQGFSENSCKKLLSRSGVTNLNTTYVSDELELMNVFSGYILNRDPDILLGYEIQMLSWGYLLDRASHLGFDICRAISRVPGDDVHNRHNAEWDAYGADNMSEIHVVGRIVLNLWRLMRTELAVYDYSFESVTFHLMHERHPRYSHRTLTNWWMGGTAQRRATNCRQRAIDYYLCRVLGNLKLITQQDLIGRTSELARLFGIQFYEVLTRGSQFRVESMMLRLAHSLNFVAMSPTTLQRAGMKAPECIPLVMEPESRFYAEPVIVVDFQSLYPSVIIAHNYCYSTCLGRVAYLGKPGKFTFGCGSLNVPPAILKQLLDNDDVTVAPNGVAFVKSHVRKGVLPLMLEEILNTRIMVKDSMKKCSSAATKRMLDHRQLGLKFIANFTYGYTSANFSGRMPCVEIADSIVHKSRETLERAIEQVNANRERWKARVVYGDTDSMFIALPLGTSRRRAFEVGRQIVDEVTQANPRPMKLKLEKVYQPCILQTKKRYVGYAYESEDQVDPIFDAKGIETVRRDGCPAVAKILEKSLRTLFDSRDVSQVKRYTEKQLSKILDGRSALQDCTIAKEYRGAKYYKPGTIVPALVLARKQLADDKRSEPRIGERVPYVIVHGTPGTQLFRLIRRPGDLLNDPRLRLHGTYYVTKMVLPALDRVMSLVGVDVFQWFRDLPRVLRVTLPQDVAAVSSHGDEIAQLSKKVTISQYFETRHCAACHSLSTHSICKDCLSRDKRHVTAVTLITQSRVLERKHQHLCMICCGCSSSSDSSNVNCITLSCPISYKRAKASQDLATANLLRRLLQENDLF